MKRRKVFATLVVLGIVGLIAGAIVIAAQQITLTTYYPAPYGEYKEADIDNVNISHILTLVPASPLPAITGSPGKGQIYYDGGSNKLKVAENGSVWANLVGGGAWTRDAGGNIYPTTSTDKVGIGTTTPTAELQVVGGIELSSIFDWIDLKGGYLRVGLQIATNSGNFTSIACACPGPHGHITGGGCKSGNTTLHIINSWPNGLTAWHCLWNAADPGNTAYCVCADIEP